MIRNHKQTTLMDFDLGEVLFAQLSSHQQGYTLKPLSIAFTLLLTAVLFLFIGYAVSASTGISTTVISFSTGLSILIVWFVKRSFLPYMLYKMIFKHMPYAKYQKADNEILAAIKQKLVMALQHVDLLEYQKLAKAHEPGLITDIDIVTSVIGDDKSKDHLNACLCTSLFINTTFDIMVSLKELEQRQGVHR